MHFYPVGTDGRTKVVKSCHKKEKKNSLETAATFSSPICQKGTDLFFGSVQEIEPENGVRKMGSGAAVGGIISKGVQDSSVGCHLVACRFVTFHTRYVGGENRALRVASSARAGGGCKT